MILEYDEFCMFLLNIEVFNIMTPDFPYTSENETKCTILYFCMFYFHLFNVLLKKVKNVDIFHEIDQKGYTPFLWYRGFYDTAVFILSVPMHCSATRRFFYLYIHKHNSHIYRNVWSFCPNVLNFFKYTYFYLFLRNSGHFYFTLIPCFVKCPIIKP